MVKNNSKIFFDLPLYKKNSPCIINIVERKQNTKGESQWGISSAGRAPALHAGGQEFESPILHHLKKRDLKGLFFNAFDTFIL